ncbi:toll/interleukin-1 receptor domain-containing protein [Alteromonas sp. ASW11-36]|uniref:Toll/interleukin-1 receptor domain-containing protein n=1 Tax=Alteromonas arenosi TaxID=3055817 RepID=A0ABT7SW46_9ALTE|nr:toll/interleukin-1 receptor domain-containing protein [Alteromonas sp. ASW11-36]MDM7860410.1 toll/interleukin-1 receptor domain-containing protein [Alteromonas sp. ASW11-36]
MLNKEKKTKRIFISYRRADTGSVAGRIKDAIERYLPNVNVFMDVETLKEGKRFKQQIIKSIDESDYVFVLIGPKWLGEADKENRLLSDDDFVRLEVAQALRANKRVYPILINDAKMPSTQEFPDDALAISQIHALEIRHSRFNDDLKHCLKSIFGLNDSHFSKSGLGDKIKAIGAGLLSAIGFFVFLDFVIGLSIGGALGKFFGSPMLSGALFLLAFFVFSNLFWQRWVR